MTNLDRMYSKIARDNGMTKKDVEEIFKSQFAVTREAMAKREDIPVRHPLFGVFRVKPKRREFIEELLNKNNNEQQD